VTLKLGAPENKVLSCVSLKNSTFSSSMGSGAGEGVGTGAWLVSAGGVCSLGVDVGSLGVDTASVVGSVAF
jgi:hypothetical protein